MPRGDNQKPDRGAYIPTPEEIDAGKLAARLLWQQPGRKLKTGRRDKERKTSRLKRLEADHQIPTIDTSEFGAAIADDTDNE